MGLYDGNSGVGIAFTDEGVADLEGLECTRELAMTGGLSGAGGLDTEGLTDAGPEGVRIEDGASGVGVGETSALSSGLLDVRTALTTEDVSPTGGDGRTMTDGVAGVPEAEPIKVDAG